MQLRFVSSLNNRAPHLPSQGQRKGDREIQPLKLASLPNDCPGRHLHIMRQRCLLAAIFYDPRPRRDSRRQVLAEIVRPLSFGVPQKFREDCVVSLTH